MPVDMKEMIAQAVRSLLFEKKVKKLTVKDIVEECHITRQAFYYHFEDIPDVLRWILQQKQAEMLEKYRSMESPEMRIEHFIRMSIQTKPYVDRVITSNFGEEIMRLIETQGQTLLRELAMESSGFASLPPYDQELLLRYHFYALMGIVRNWREADNAHIDEIVHEIYLVATNQLHKKLCV